MTEAGQQAVDEYFAAAPEAARPILRELRQAIREAAPKADERISYGMPFYEQQGRVTYFAVHKNHVGLYVVGRAKELFAKELEPYMAGKSTARFSFGTPVPVELVRKLVEARVEELESKGGGDGPPAGPPPAPGRQGAI